MSPDSRVSQQRQPKPLALAPPPTLRLLSPKRTFVAGWGESNGVSRDWVQEIAGWEHRAGGADGLHEARRRFGGG